MRDEICKVDDLTEICKARSGSGLVRSLVYVQVVTGVSTVVYRQVRSVRRICKGAVVEVGLCDGSIHLYKTAENEFLPILVLGA